MNIINKIFGNKTHSTNTLIDFKFEPKNKFGLKSLIDYKFLNLNKINYSVDSFKIIGEHYTLHDALQKKEYKRVIDKYLFSKKKEGYINEFIKSNHKNAYVIPLKTQEEVNTLNLIQKKSNALIYIMLIVKEGVVINFDELIQVMDFCGVYLEVVLLKNSKLQYLSYANVKTDKTLIIARNFYLENNATLEYCDINLNYKNYIAHTDVYLSKKSSSFVNVVGVVKDQFLKESEINIHHEGMLSSSRVVYKNLICDNSKTYFKGLINIKKDTVGCEANLQEDNLLLGDNVHQTSMPNLEINNNDVQCSHSISITKVNEEKLFYIQSKGLNEKQAKSILINAHIEPIISTIQNIGVREDIKKIINKKFINL